MTFTERHILLLFWMLCSGSMLFAQGEMGLAHGNYNVTEGIRINPAASVDPLPFFDFHVVGANGFFDNNLVYFADEDFNLYSGQLPGEAKTNFSLVKKNGQLEVNALGPAFNYPIHKFSIGMSTALRHYTSFRNIPFHVAQNFIDNFENEDLFNQTFEGDDFRVNSLTWEELGVHFGGIVYQDHFDMLNVAVNLKYLLGTGGLSFRGQNFDYTLIDQDNVTFNRVNAEYTATFNGLNNGRGWGMDIGAVYKKMKKVVNDYTPHDPLSDCKSMEYEYKLGVSILDLGGINFDNNSFYRKIENGSVSWDELSDFDPQSTKDFVNEFDEKFEDDITEAKNSYRAYLPAALSIQYDHNLGRNYYVNATSMLALRRIRKFGAERIDYLAVTPRYELRNFEMAAPISLNRFLDPGVGFAFRFWYLSMGTNNIVPYLIGDVYGMNAYFHIKWKFYKSKRCDVELLRPAWRVNDCSAPRIDSRTKKKYKKENKGRIKRDKKRRKRYSGN